MDKYEYNIKAEQIVKLINKRDFATAAKIADGIDWKRVRNVNMLTNVGKVYEEVGRYGDAREILLMAFEKAPLGRRLAYKLTELCIRMNDFEEAEHYYGSFLALAPRDTARYELQYKLAKKKGEPVEHLIAILQEYKRNDFEAAWAYELARLYHKEGMADACVAECDEIILWFGEGEYVDKAMELKLLYGPLSPSQQEKYDRRYQPQSLSQTEEEEQPSGQEEADIETEQLPKEPVTVSMGMYSTANIQEVLAESMKELMKEEAGADETVEPDSAKGLFRVVPFVDRRSLRTDIPADTENTGTEAAEEEAHYVKTENAESGHIEAETAEAEDIRARAAKADKTEVWAVETDETEAQAVEADETEAQAAEADRIKTGAVEEKTRRLDAAVRLEPDQYMEEITVPEEAEQALPGHLSEERRKAFASFLHINGMEEKLAEIFQEAEQTGEEKTTSLFGNILIVGDHKSGKTMLATELMKNLSRIADRKNRKIAKISGDRLNNKGIKETIARLAGADLLIERAGEMNQTTVEALLRAMEGDTGGMVVVLEDTQSGMDGLIRENPDITVRFTHRLVLKEYEISEWVELAKQYAVEKDYGIDEMATLALSAKIASLYTQKTVVEMEDVRALIDAAIEHSEKKNIKKLFETVFSRKYKDSDLAMLRENDFT